MLGSTSGSTPSPDDMPESSGKDTLSLAARRAKLRGTLTGRGFPETTASEPPATSTNTTGLSVTTTGDSHKAKPSSEKHESGLSASAQVTGETSDKEGSSKDSASPPTGSTPVNTGTGAPQVSSWAPSAIPPQNMAATISAPQVTLRARPTFGISMGSDITRSGAAEMLKNIDQAMAACAANLANLQKVASEQADALKVLTATLQDKNLHDAGFNLNTLTESFSAALEPMKEVVRLVPAIDQLKSTVNEHLYKENKIAPDDLITNLAQQLTDGAINPRTFKSAYKAIFPDKSAADLLRGLVELLGTQRLSGTLFRAAYDAVQTSEPTSDEAQLASDPTTLPAFEELSKANKELQETLTKREEELEKMLADKDLELQNVQAQMAKQYEEIDNHYAKVNQQVTSREQDYDSLLKSKDKEITERESELTMLRRQMEELRSQTQELVTSLQEQVAEKTAAAAKSISGTKDKTAQSAVQPKEDSKLEPKSKSVGGFFEADERPKSFYADDSTSNPAAQRVSQTTQPVAATPAVPVTAASAVVKPGMTPIAAPGNVLHKTVASPIGTAKSPVANPTPDVPSAPQVSSASQVSSAFLPASGAGRHGTGVRAQVFEVIVRQALAGAPWRELCAGPMQVNNITAEEVEAEVRRRQGNSS